MESRTNYAQQQLDQYTKTKEQIFSIDQERSQGPSWKQALTSPAIEKNESQTDKVDAWKSTLEKDYSHLSAEQQERYADLRLGIQERNQSVDKELGIE